MTRAAVFWHAYSNDHSVILTPDSLTYEQPARALAVLGRFAAHASPDAAPELDRTPGYPLFIAFCYKIFGFRWPPVLLLQIATSILSIYFVFWLGCRIGGPEIGLVAALLLAIDPVTFLYSQLMRAETLFTATLLLIVLVACRWMDSQRRQWIWAALLGALIGVETHIRPIAYLMVVPMGIWLLVSGMRMRKGWRTTIFSFCCL